MLCPQSYWLGFNTATAQFYIVNNSDYCLFFFSLILMILWVPLESLTIYQFPLSRDFLNLPCITWHVGVMEGRLKTSLGRVIKGLKDVQYLAITGLEAHSASITKKSTGIHCLLLRINQPVNVHRLKIKPGIDYKLNYILNKHSGPNWMAKKGWWLFFGLFGLFSPQWLCHDSRSFFCQEHISYFIIKWPSLFITYI